jgi:CDP-diacylglycerol--glycerol-3-phosphate 3-phosphatidyltransferase
MNIANKLTLSRVIMIPIFLILLLTGIPNGQIWAAVVFIIASLTDALDGYIARRYNLTTDFGIFLDPLADKILVISALVGMVEVRILPAWAVIVIIGRELMVTSIRLLAVTADGNVIAASVWGKVKTASQMIAIILLLLSGEQSGLRIFAYVVFYLSVLMTILSGWDYLRQNLHLFGKKSK